ncbi:hypothetical protein [Micromonospora echinofusca]|uniref:hypothetical protein n=1 Tax=Micromonospora echinofusca TaxID=47858 RepID=UPI0033C3DE89
MAEEAIAVPAGSLLTDDAHRSGLSTSNKPWRKSLRLEPFLILRFSPRPKHPESYPEEPSPGRSHASYPGFLEIDDSPLVRLNNREVGDEQPTSSWRKVTVDRVDPMMRNRVSGVLIRWWLICKIGHRLVRLQGFGAADRGESYHARLFDGATLRNHQEVTGLQLLHHDWLSRIYLFICSPNVGQWNRQLRQHEPSQEVTLSKRFAFLRAGGEPHYRPSDFIFEFYENLSALEPLRDRRSARCIDSFNNLSIGCNSVRIDKLVKCVMDSRPDQQR